MTNLDEEAENQPLMGSSSQVPVAENPAEATSKSVDGGDTLNQSRISKKSGRSRASRASTRSRFDGTSRKSKKNGQPKQKEANPKNHDNRVEGQFEE